MILDQLVQIGSAIAARGRSGDTRERRSGTYGPVSINSLEAADLLAGGMGDVWSGEEINHRTSMTYAAYWRAITIVGNGCGGIPLKLHRKTDSGSEVVTNDPRHRLMRFKPNPYTLAQDFFRTRVYHAMDWGNGYAYIVRRGGKPFEIRQLDPGLTTVERTAGVLKYRTEQLEGGKWVSKTLDREDVFHVRGLGDDGICGFDVVRYAKNTLGIGLAAQHHGGAFFKHGASPGFFFEHPGKLGPEAHQNLRETIRDALSGLMNAHRPFILEEGMKANQVAIDHQKSQFIELRKFEIRDIANVTGVPAYMLGDSEQSAYASLEQRSQDFLDHTLNPWLKQIESEATDKLLTEAEQEQGFYFEFERAAIVSIDHKTKVESATNELNNGGLTLNEYRRIMNRAQVPGTIGDQYRMPSNITVIEEPGDDDGGAGDDLAFKREVVKSFIADGTIGDVVFNLTDGRKLLDAVNLPTIPDMEEPWLPVVAASGPLVSGDVIEDPQGDIVGGDVVAGKGAEGPGEKGSEGPRGQGAEGEEGDGDGIDPPADGKQDGEEAGAKGPRGQGAEDEEQNDGDTTATASEDDLETPDGIRSAYDRIVKQARAERLRTARSLAAIERDAWGRMVKRIAHRAVRAAAKPESFNAFVEGLERADRAVVMEAVAPVESLRSRSRAETQARVKKFFGWVRSELLACAEVKADELAAEVERWARRVTR